jgi:hypothetical protein
MVGLGETDEEILQVMRDLRTHGVDMLTIGQYLAPTSHHLPVRRYVHPDVFRMFESEAAGMGFSHAPAARWCARATTRISRRTQPGWVACPLPRETDHRSARSSTLSGSKWMITLPRLRKPGCL